MRLRTTTRAGAAAGTILLSLALLAGCAPGTSGPATDDITQEQIDAAMQEPTTLTYWSWLNKEHLDSIVAEFQKKYPAITVKFENPAPTGQQGQFLRTALEAGTGIPDLVQFSGDFSSFVLSGDLLDLTPYGAKKVEDEFLPSAWESVVVGDGIYGIPQDLGPIGVLYRQDLLEAAGITELPTTWQEFADVAEEYHNATGQYLTNISALELGILMSQVGDQQYQWDGGEDITIAIDTPEHREVMAYAQDLIDRGIVATDAEFTDSYYQGMVNGKYASWIIAAWGPTFLQGVASSTAGSWEASALPQWEGLDERNPTIGGSQIGVTAKSSHPIQAAVFAQWLNTDPAATTVLTNNLALFPATFQQTADTAWLDREDPFFGGQKVNALWAEIAEKSTATKESPLGSYVNQALQDTVSVALANGAPFEPAYAELQRKIVEYATSQGFTVTEG